MIIKKIFDGNFDEEVHAGFLKFGRGEYRDKFLISGKKQTRDWAIKGDASCVNFFVRRCLEKVDGPVSLTGVIISTLDLKDDITFNIKKVGNFQGVRKFQIDDVVGAEDIFALMDKYPRAFFAFTFKGDDFTLKVKPKAPTSGKPGKEKEDGPVADFCSLKTSDKSFVDELFFDIRDFGEVKVGHTVFINDIIYPDNVAELKPAEVRELAKRKGVVRRIVSVDGVEKVSEANFLV